jgi:hypothetical protein
LTFKYNIFRIDLVKKQIYKINSNEWIILDVQLKEIKEIIKRYRLYQNNSISSNILLDDI